MSDTRTRTHTLTHTLTHTYMHTHLPARPPARPRTHARTHARTHRLPNSQEDMALLSQDLSGLDLSDYVRVLFSFVCTRTHAHTHTHAHARTHTCMYAHMYAPLTHVHERKCASAQT